MALHPHVNGEVAVMLVIVGDVVHQHGPRTVLVDPVSVICAICMG